VILLVGLGNPGRKYEKNRHNVGFVVADAVRDDKRLPDYREKFSALFSKGDALSILKPQTYMNVSGDSVQPAQSFLKVAPQEIVVVHDELDLPFGEVRLKVGGGHAGHNGLRSIIQRLGTPEFVRVRVGIGRPPPGFRGEVADYVLQDFDASERAEVPDVVDRAKKAIDLVLDQGTAAAMNTVNQKTPVRNSPRAKA
jgi:PTH1 family peptidyl-tRNA hydrolase